MPRKNTKKTEKDSTYLLKIVLYMILGTLWIGFPQPIGPFAGLPVGFFLGLLFASHDHFAIDRKIEFAILIIMATLSAIFKISIML